jgi:hypothetical protein
MWCPSPEMWDRNRHEVATMTGCSAFEGRRSGLAGASSCRDRSFSSRSLPTWLAPYHQSSRRCQEYCRRLCGPPAMRRTSQSRRYRASPSSDVRARSATRRSCSLSSDVGWPYPDRSLDHRRPEMRWHACARAFQREGGWRCCSTVLTEQRGRLSRFAREKLRAWLAAHGTAEPPAIPTHLRGIRTR